MTGFWRRLSVRPPNIAIRGDFPLRGIVSFKHARGPAGVSLVDVRRFFSCLTLICFLLASVLSSDVSIVHLTSYGPLIFRVVVNNVPRASYRPPEESRARQECA